MARANIKAVVRDLELGEGPHWSEERQELLFVDLFGKSLHRYEPSTGQHTKLTMDDNSSVIIPIESKPDEYIISAGRKLLKLDWDGKSREEVTSISSLKEIAIVDDHSPGNKFNDGKVDSKGRLWIGTLGSGTLDNFEMEKGSLYRLGLDGQVSSQLDKISIANGLAWSSDNKKFFYVDTLAYTVSAFDFDESAGTLSNRQILTDFKKDGLPGLPDGMCIDASNNLWVASFGTGRVLHIDSTTGKLIDEINFEGRASATTSVAFGGPHLDTLYVTSGTFSVTPEQLAVQSDPGALFEVTNIGAKAISGGLSFKGNLLI